MNDAVSAYRITEHSAEQLKGSLPTVNELEEELSDPTGFEPADANGESD